ncbi:MAG: tRNA (guanosine(46)-N7)-methyltransferase TrmB [Clostridia bacterium]|nr:tRNA (guanosine(46)-N7)-methyltransferase TrmB [Clostridia bacterium]
MRMRKKKNLETRLEACRSKLIIIEREERDFNSADEIKEYIDFSPYFEKEQPIFLEIGCGKGQFVCEMAERHPEINYIAVEKVGNVIVSAAENAMKRNLKNVVFLKCAAEYLSSYIKEGTVEGLYLNFSCPYPKKAYASHRLTASNFLKIYKLLMKRDAEIHFKTDNRGLFEFSLEQLSNNGYAFKNVSLDLHNSDFEGNIVTEYEQRFVSLGCPIYRLEAYLK